MKQFLAILALLAWLAGPVAAVAQLAPPLVLRNGKAADQPPSGVTAGQYGPCGLYTFEQYGRTTAAQTTSCIGPLAYPFNTCSNNAGIITCTAPCVGWPIVICATNSAGGLPAIPLTLAVKPQVGDVLLAGSGATGGSSLGPVGAVGAGWTGVTPSPCGNGGLPHIPYTQPSTAYHIVGPNDGQIYSPFTDNGSFMQWIVDLSALGAARGSWAAAFNSGSSSCGGAVSPPLTVSGTTPVAGAVELAVGNLYAANGSYGSMSLSGISTGLTTGEGFGSNPLAGGLGFGLGGASGSAYSASFSWTGGGIGSLQYLGVFFFNPGSQLAVPSCSAVGGTPTCAMTSQSGPASLYMTLGAAASATSLSVANLPSVANAYICDPLMDITTPGIWGLQSGFSTTGATFTFYTKGTATAASPGAADVVMTSCWGS